MNKKVILGLSLAALAIGYSQRYKIFGNSSSSNNTLPSGGNISIADLEGKAISTEGDQGIYKVVNGQKVTYEDYQAYLNDGAIPLTMINGDMFNKITSANYYISQTGIVKY